MTVSSKWHRMLLRYIAVPDCDVEVWCASSDLLHEQICELEKILSADEQKRAARFVFARDRCRFVAARGILRVILSRYLSCEPAGIRFHYERDGRPELIAPVRDKALHFNVSHASDLALFAISRNCRVGIDVEQLRSIPEAEAMVREQFSPREQAAWRALPQDRKQEAFLQAWTRKEAVLKALGVGLSCSPDRIEVTFGRDKPALLLSIDGDETRAAEISLLTVLPAHDFVGALASCDPTVFPTRNRLGRAAPGNA